MKCILYCFITITLALTGALHSAAAPWSARLTRDAIVSSDGIVLAGEDRLSTPGTFAPPVEITIVAKTDSTNIRLAYAADQVIFNWELDPEQFRVDGGPANGQHRSGAGSIPVDRYVVIRWVVTPKFQEIYVDNELRFQHRGDYSGVNRCVSIFPAAGSKVTVKSLQVRQPASQARSATDRSSEILARN